MPIKQTIKQKNNTITKKILPAGLVTVVILLLFAILAIHMTNLSGDVTASRGCIDMTDIDFSVHETHRLNGEWEFYPNQIIEPGDFADKTPEYTEVPAMRGSDTNEWDYATYRLRIELPETNMQLATIIPLIYMDSRVLINSRAVMEDGVFTDSAETYPHKGISAFTPDDRYVEIVVQVYSGGYVYPGITDCFEIGERSVVRGLSSIRLTLDVVFVIVSLFVAVYYLLMFGFEKKMFRFLFFALACLAFAMRSMMLNEVPLAQLWIHIPFKMGYILRALSVPAMVVGLIMNTIDYVKAIIPRPARIFTIAVSALYSLLQIILPISAASQIVPYYLVIVICAAIVYMYVILKSLARGYRDAVPAYAGTLCIILCMCYDMLIYLRIINARYLIPFGFFVYIMIYSVLLAKSYSESYHNIAHLSDGLQRALDRAANTETAYLNAQMKPHFLYNTLNTIADYCTTDPHEAERLIIILSKYLRNTLDYENLGDYVSLGKETAIAKGYVEIIAARFPNISFAFGIPKNAAENVLIPPMILQPLIENAVNHGIRKREGGGCVSITGVARGGYVYISINDDGVGIQPDQTDKLLVTPKGDGSIGLYNINQRLLRIYGEGISIKSYSGLGTCVSFRIPVDNSNDGKDTM